MPWSVGDVDKHKRGLGPSSQRKWVSIANAVLKRTGNEASAIRIANNSTKVTAGSIQRRLAKKKGV